MFWKILTRPSTRHLKQLAANVLESSIVKVKGHKSTNGLKSYNPNDQGKFNPPGANQSALLNIQSASTSSCVESKPT